MSISFLITGESVNELADSCEYWYLNGAKSFHPRLAMAAHGIWRQDANETNIREILARIDVHNKYSGWVMVPSWFKRWVSNFERPDTRKPFDKCYSGFCRFGVSPYRKPGTNLRRIKPDSLPATSVTDDAWISSCLYYRYDERFGCIYPDDFMQWCKDGRIHSTSRICPDGSRTGKNIVTCHDTVCSRIDVNREIHGEVLSLA